MSYAFHIVVIVEIYALVAMGLNLASGVAGRVSLGQAAFFGLGAYGSAILALQFGVPFPLDLVVASAIAAAVAGLLACPLSRLREDYFVVATVAFQLAAYGIFRNAVRLTGGPMGLPAIPRPVLFGWWIDSQLEFALMGLVACIGIFLVLGKLQSSPFGRILRASREDEVFAAANGKNVSQARTIVLIISAMCAALGGSIYARYITFIDPTSFTLMEAVLFLSMIIVGGAGSRWGPVIGAAILVAMPEVLRFVGIPSAASANIRQIIYGLGLVACMVWRPQGLVGEYAFGKKENDE